MTLHLHCFGESGHSYKAALGLTLAGLDWQPVHVDFFAGEARGEAFRRDVNAMGECPVLDTGTERLTQSGVILHWITDRTGLLGGAERDRYEVLRWVLWDNHKMSSQAGMIRFLLNFLPAEKRPEGAMPFLEGRLAAALGVLDAHLAGRDWIVGDGVTHADLSCCSYLFYPEPFGFDREAHANIDRWLANIEALPGWKHPYDMMRRAWPAA
ncbi:MAG: glutathione S-transferase [Rhodobacteraceae bacterium HLUCCA08]|nr:MAG: glutathione S-transferase [Rhodobacteraceae bacterium HLUCCA08]